MVLGSGVAWGQFRTETEPFTTTNNCTGYKDPRVPPYRSINWSAGCKNNKIHGAGVLTFESLSRNDNLWWPSVHIGFMNEGIRTGISIRVGCVENNKPECVSLVHTEVSGMHFIGQFARDTQKRPRYLASSDVTAMTRLMKDFEADLKGAPTVNTGDLLALMKEWSSDPEMTLDKFKNFKPAAYSGGETKGDDPKVFGRSARGG